ncbi:hypothetical protein [Mesorhizobium amorphae]|uniref:hypothetical protein n=1 Tax=Mesorhizobium amorphae TaxID=71433 RepID=UPI0024E06A2C|nr:hypothetical protein [Mesorhizobium amorphae]
MIHAENERSESRTPRGVAYALTVRANEFGAHLVVSLRAAADQFSRRWEKSGNSSAALASSADQLRSPLFAFAPLVSVPETSQILGPHSNTHFRHANRLCGKVA